MKAVFGLAAEGAARVCRLIVLLLAGMALASPGIASGAEQKADDLVHFDIPRQRTDRALIAFAEQAELTFIFPVDEARKTFSRKLRGQFTRSEAIAILLDGTRLHYQINSTGGLAINVEPDAAQKGEEMRKAGIFARLASLFVACGLATASNPACAQASAPEQSAAGESRLEEVVVTAQKREESLQKTPIAITAFGAADLADLRITDVTDLANTAPSVVIAPYAGGKATPNIFIRGMGNTDHQMTKDNAVGIYIDGVPVGRNQGLMGDVADLARVEILRGPQGTLYGRNSTAGAINLITNKPEKDFAFEQEVGAGNYDLVWGRTTLNAPLTDTLMMRAVYMTGQKDGWVKNTNHTLPNQTDFNMEDKEALRASVRWLATDAFTVDYSYDYSNLDYGNVFFQVATGPTAPKGRQESVYVKRGLQPSNSMSQGHNLTLALDLDGVELKSITGYRGLDYVVYQDFTNVFNQHVHDQMTAWSEELQLLGNALDNRLEYVAGAFFYDEDGTRDRLSDFQVARDHTYIDATSKSLAAYAQATWTPPVLTDRLRLTLGGRYTHDERKATKVFLENGLAPTVPDGLTVSGDRSFDKFNPAFTVDFAFTDNINGYARYATGYRAGGFNSSSTPQGFSDGFDPENVDSYELGLKADLLDGRARINSALFRNEYSDLQVDQVRTPSIFADTVNAGSATMQGFELEATAILVHGLTANVSYSYLDAQYDEYLDNGIDKAKLGLVAVPFAPDSTLAARLKYESDPMPIGMFSVGLDFQTTDDFYSGASKSYAHNNGYSLWNARAQLGEIPLAKGSLTVALWGQNLLDEKYTVIGAPVPSRAHVYGEPRTFGVDFSFKY